MKKFIALMMSVLMACSVMTACSDSDDKDDDKVKKNDSSVSESVDDGKKDDESKKEDESKEDDSKEDDSKGGEELGADFKVEVKADAAAPLGETVGDDAEIDTSVFDILTGMETAEKYTIDMVMSMNSQGMAMEIPIVATKDGDNSYVYTNMLFANVKVLTLDGKSYLIDDTNKIYCSSDADQGEDVMDGMDVSDVADVADSIKASKKVTINGKEFVRYEAESDGESVFVYIYGGELKYMAAYSETNGSALVTFNKLSNEPDASLLKLPEGYTEVSEDEYSKTVYGDLGLDEDMDFDIDE